MLKKLGFALIFAALSFFVFNTSVTAQSNSGQKIKLPIKEILGDKEIPGVTCGDGSNEDVKRCCNIKEIDTKIEPPDPDFFCIPFGGPCASDLPKDAMNEFVNKSTLTKQMEDLAKLAKKGDGCVVGKASGSGNSCTCKASPLSTLCARYLKDSPGEVGACNNCVANGDGVWTGLGCIKITPAGFVASMMGLGIGIAGGIAFLCILYAAILMQTSGGNPERIKKSREYLTACITGLILIIFSVLILRIIGVNILGIPFLQ